jgi:hypothetical protein
MAAPDRWPSALLALAHLRCDTHAQLAAGFGIGIATVYRYVREAVDVLAAVAPTLAEAMKTASTKAFVILDGTLLPIGRIAAETPSYSGKHERHGMNVLVLADPFGRLVWASAALPGSTHDLTETMEAAPQHHPRQDPQPRRARHGHSQELAPAAEDPLQHQPDHHHREGCPRPPPAECGLGLLLVENRVVVRVDHPELARGVGGKVGDQLSQCFAVLVGLTDQSRPAH